jgi:nitroimidazol reductase NimA-like FMN-containing flavoprotein (pyridoxamine 5'-phosphate oxidase superfamily)
MRGTTLEVLTEEECYALLRENVATVGRVGVSVGAVPEILPVNFAMIDGTIIFRTGQGSKLHAATRDAVLAFEVDDSDASSGWSVLVVGRSAEVTDDLEVASTLAVIPDGWVPGEHEHVVRITPSRVTGRRIHRRE